MKNNVSGEIKVLTEDEFLKLFYPKTQSKVKLLGDQADTQVLVCFENLQMDSSNCGHRQAMAVGPKRTYQVETLRTMRLGDVPSQFTYPVAVWLSHMSEEEFAAVG